MSKSNIDIASLEPNVISYIAQLRRESASYRLRAKALQAELDALRGSSDVSV